MSLGLDVKELVTPPPASEATPALVRFGDTTDQFVSKLRYHLPVPASYEGRLFIQLKFAGLPWSNAAKGGTSKTEAIKDSTTGFTTPLVDIFLEKPEYIYDWFIPPKGPLPDPAPDLIETIEFVEQPGGLAAGMAPGETAPIVRRNLLLAPLTLRADQAKPTDAYTYLKIGEAKVSFAEIAWQAEKGYALQVYQTPWGSVEYNYVKEAKDEDTANSRFVIVEHYRLTSHFGDYGAGRTIQTFSLWPGEETTLYIRNWRRTEETAKQASSIFDSYTDTAAQEFSKSVSQENSARSVEEETWNWETHASGSFFGLFGGGASGGMSSKSTREDFAKTVGNAAVKHASSASAKREIKVSTEVEVKEAAEFESITERTVKNVNLSRVLNLVVRELNQEFVTYLTLVDVSVAFMNDRTSALTGNKVFEEVPLHQVDDLIDKYVETNWGANKPTDVQGNETPREYAKRRLWEEMAVVYDYQDQPKQLLEEAPLDPQHPEMGMYWRMRRRGAPEDPHPFYPQDPPPAEGIILNKAAHVLPTDGVIMDALLGHGVALDNYALGTQQEVLREKQLTNRKLELALKLVEEADPKKIDAFHSLLVCCPDKDLAEILMYLVSKPVGEQGEIVTIPEGVPAPRLAVDKRGRVNPNNEIPLNIRSGPGLNAAVVTTWPGGTEFVVTDGPRYADGYLWWRLDNGTEQGWGAEGVIKGYYYLEPFFQE